MAGLEMGLLSQRPPAPARHTTSGLTFSAPLSAPVTAPGHIATPPQQQTEGRGTQNEPELERVACCVVQAPHALFGTFFSPGIIEVATRGDRLMALVLLSVSAMFIVVVWILEDLRRVIRPGGPLQGLGAGSRRITCAQYAEVESVMHKFHPGHTPAKLKVAAVAFGLSIVFVNAEGVGMQTPLHNRVSAAVTLAFYSAANTLIAVWIITMRMATILSGDAVGGVVTSIKSISRSVDLSEEVWQETVYQPAAALADDTMATLSVGWGRTVVLYCVLCLLGDIAVAALMLSPLALYSVDASWWPLALRFGCCWGLLIFTLLPVFVASGPAHVSSQCDELMNSLNHLRLRLGTIDADARITVLEKALKSLNSDQGLGFLVARTVIDKGKLNRFAKGVAGLVVTLGPIMLAWGATTARFRAAESCTLSAEQEGALKAVAETFHRSGCTFNVSLSIGPDAVIMSACDAP